MRQSCTKTENLLQQVQEDTERLHHLQLTRETEARRLQEQVSADQELIEGLLEKLTELDKDEMLLMQYWNVDNAALKVRWYENIFSSIRKWNDTE